MSNNTNTMDASNAHPSAWPDPPQPTIQQLDDQCDALNADISKLKAELFRLVNALNTTSYKRPEGQIADAKMVGALAGQWEARRVEYRAAMNKLIAAHKEA